VANDEHCLRSEKFGASSNTKTDIGKISETRQRQDGFIVLLKMINYLYFLVRSFKILNTNGRDWHTEPAKSSCECRKRNVSEKQLLAANNNGTLRGDQLRLFTQRREIFDRVLNSANVQMIPIEQWHMPPLGVVSNVNFYQNLVWEVHRMPNQKTTTTDKQ
jgi:hypothetical protein